MLKLLLIDDDKINNFLNRSIIEKNCGNECIVSEYTNPEEAYDFLKHSILKATENCPDVVFLDINMPEMSGFEFLERMRDEDVVPTHTKIFILSSSLDPGDIERSKSFTSVSDFISKPLDKDKIEKIKSLVKSN
ncbi:MAG: response regulator [Bacteroidota bacterium]